MILRHRFIIYQKKLMILGNNFERNRNEVGRTEKRLLMLNCMKRLLQGFFKVCKHKNTSNLKSKILNLYDLYIGKYCRQLHNVKKPIIRIWKGNRNYRRSNSFNIEFQKLKEDMINYNSTLSEIYERNISRQLNSALNSYDCSRNFRTSIKENHYYSVS